MPPAKEAPMPELSIVIVNYNTRDKLRDCLQSLDALRHEVDFEIIVVDNASSDKSAVMIREFSSVRLIEAGRNSWFSGGNNIGLAAAKGRYVWLLNPDTLVQPQTIPTMLQYLKTHPEVGAVTNRQQHPNGEMLPVCALARSYSDLLLDDTLLSLVFSAWRKNRRKRLWYSDWQRDTWREVEVAPGSSIMAETALIRSFGAFDETFKLYLTDDDLCHDIRATGKSIHFLSDALILHYEKSTVANRSRFAREIYFGDMLVYSRKHFGLLPSLFLRFWVILSRWAMDAKQSLKEQQA
jgi:GT2 family glycosyltransferase